MKKLLLTSFIAIAAIAGMHAREFEEITVDGRERTYVYYEPTTSNNEVVLLLHGLGETYDDYDATAMQDFANKNNCTLILPQALPEQDSDLLGVLDLAGSYDSDIKLLKDQLAKSAWGANVYITIDDLCEYLGTTKQMLTLLVQSYYPQYMKYITAGKLQINQYVNDRNFINQLIIGFRENADTKFHVVGCSLGGALAYDLGFNTPENITKIASLSGFVSKGVEVPDNYNTPTLVIHSKSDEIIPYDGGLYNRPIGAFVLDIAYKTGTRIPKVTVLNSDQSTDRQITLMDWESDPHDRYYLVEQAKHNLVDDMAALGYNVYDVVADFLFDKHVAADETMADSKSLVIYPNPVENIANVNIAGKYSIINMAGVTVSKGYTEGTIDMTSVSAGRYILTIETENTVNRAIIIKK